MGTQKKKGRPIKGDKELNIDLKVRVDERTNFYLKRYANEHSITKAETVRLAINEFLSQKK